MHEGTDAQLLPPFDCRPALDGNGNYQAWWKRMWQCILHPHCQLSTQRVAYTQAGKQASRQAGKQQAASSKQKAQQASGFPIGTSCWAARRRTSRRRDRRSDDRFERIVAGSGAFGSGAAVEMECSLTYGHACAAAPSNRMGCWPAMMAWPGGPAVLGWV